MSSGVVDAEPAEDDRVARRRLGEAARVLHRVDAGPLPAPGGDASDAVVDVPLQQVVAGARRLQVGVDQSDGVVAEGLAGRRRPGVRDGAGRGGASEGHAGGEGEAEATDRRGGDPAALELLLHGCGTDGQAVGFRGLPRCGHARDP